MALNSNITSSTSVYVTTIVLLIFTFAAVGLRLLVRLKQDVRFRYDDWVQLPALSLFIAMCVCGLVGVGTRSLGYPLPPFNPADPDYVPSVVYLSEKLNFALFAIEVPCLTLIKTAALAFYRRVFVVHKNSWLDVVTKGLLVLVICWGVTFFVYLFTACGSHVSALWGGEASFEEYCIPGAADYDVSFAVTDWSLDLFILLVPILPICQLKISMQRKIAVAGVFSVALIGFGASLARMVVFIQLAFGLTDTATLDILLEDTEAYWFRILENGCALIAVNLPSISSTALRIVPTWLNDAYTWVSSRASSLTGFSGSSSSQESKMQPTQISEEKLVYSDRASDTQTTNDDQTQNARSGPSSYLPSSDLERGEVWASAR